MLLQINKIFQKFLNNLIINIVDNTVHNCL